MSKEEKIKKEIMEEYITVGELGFLRKDYVAHFCKHSDGNSPRIIVILKDGDKQKEHEVVFVCLADMRLAGERLSNQLRSFY